MRKRLAVGSVLVLAFLAIRLSSLAVILPPPAKTVTLTWDYPLADPNIVFNVYSTTNILIPKRDWSFVTNVVERSCVLVVEAGARFFTVTASNVVTGMESER